MLEANHLKKINLANVEGNFKIRWLSVNSGAVRGACYQHCQCKQRTAGEHSSDTASGYVWPRIWT